MRSASPRRILLIGVAGISLAAAPLLTARAGTPISKPHLWTRSGSVPTQGATPAISGDRSTTECVTAPSQAANVVLDCPSEYKLPNRETSFTVDPEDPKHLVEASMDGPFGDQTIEFATSFDGGTTWTIGDIPHGEGLGNFDPWVTFDLKHHEVVIAFPLGRTRITARPQAGRWRRSRRTEG